MISIFNDECKQMDRNAWNVNSLTDILTGFCEIDICQHETERTMGTKKRQVSIMSQPAPAKKVAILYYLKNCKVTKGDKIWSEI